LDAFTKDEILALLGAARRESEADWLMLAVTFIHGLRVSETLALTRDNVVDGELVVSRLKGSKRTKQPLFDHPNPLLSERKPLIDLAAKAKGNQRLFPLSRWTFQRRIQDYGKTAGLSRARCHPHALKHSILSQMIEKATISEVRDWAGHKSMASTGMYLNPSSAKVAAAARRALE
jgi:integrase